jgi:Protein of unknown function (DUF1592)/Protein of unknown function (DUF1588)/Protein of unknown function (DUF1587)/Protein of unknown function (DUF1585)/Protein of unknown function (DUF1595)/Planctomycete cytochrome C
MTRLFAGSVMGALGLLAAEPVVPVPANIRPFIQNHCVDCHDADSARAGFRIDLLSADFTAGNNASLWKEVMDKINGGEMPPKKKPRPDAKEAFRVTSWVAQQLNETTKIAQGAGGRVPMRRMNRVEYANTVRDIFSLEEHFARRIEKELPSDGEVGGFDRGGASLFMDEGQLTRYMAVADLVLDEAIFIEKPDVKKFTWNALNEKYVHGINAASKDATGEVIDTNPPPGVVATFKEPLAKISVDKGLDVNQSTGKVNRYVPHGPFYWTAKNGGIEYLAGTIGWPAGNLRIPFHAEDWGKKGVNRDGWYRFRIKAGAFKGGGKEEQKEVRLFVEYGLGSPIEVLQSAVIDAPLDAPKEYVFMMYLQAGSPGMFRSWRIGWDNGKKDVVITNPLYRDVQAKPGILADWLGQAIGQKKPAEFIADLKKQSEVALVAALENRKNFAGPMWIYDPKFDIANRPRLWIGEMNWEGPIVEWPSKARQTLFFAGEGRADDAYLREIFARIVPIAYRRPAAASEIERMVTWTLKNKAARALTFNQAVREGVKNLLCSPAFLYLGSESQVAAPSAAPATGPKPINDWQLASRLSYLLWSSAPDQELFKLAAAGKLHDPSVMRAQVKRLLADRRSTEFVRNFAGQWLSVRNFENGNPPSRNFYRQYDDALRDSSKREPLEFFQEVLQKNLPLTNFLDSEFLVIDERLAKHYGIEGVVGENFRRVPAPADGRRGGVLGMAGLMTFLADGTRTLPVRRATWVLDKLWNQPVPPPPPNAGELPAIKGQQLTVRERLDQHRLSENCASCHTRVDAFGLALENYDAVGMWRDRQNGEGMQGDKGSPLLDVSGQLPDGSAFKTVQEFKAALLVQKKVFARAFVEKFLCYSLGRPIVYGDHVVVDQITAQAAAHDYRLQEVIQATVASSLFQTQ